MAFQGSLKELPLPDVIQLVAVSGKTGRFSLENRRAKGTIYLRDGEIVHAEVGELQGEEAVYELAIWADGAFEFSAGEPPPNITIDKSNTSLLMEAARRIDEWKILSKKVPSTRLVPTFKADGGKSSVSLNPEEWAVIRKIDERRSIDEIAVSLSSSSFDTSKTIYGLVTSGLVDLKEDLRSLPVEYLRQMSNDQLEAVAAGIHRTAAEFLADHESAASQIEPLRRLCSSQLATHRGFEAVLDLIRGEEKIVSSTLGPHQAKSFLESIAGVISQS